MKKIVFTIQMIALIAMIPVYLVVELNRDTTNSPMNNSDQEMNKAIKSEKTTAQPAADQDYKTVSLFNLNACVARPIN